MARFELHLGDCLEVLKTMPDNSVDAVVCDPPYGLSFMGRKWDYDVPEVAVWAECLRVLKPGGHLLAFAGTRTQHRMAVRIEDAGFEIRDMIAWVYGSGFPKHQSALKPALEPITMARKPAKVATLLNIDACRVESERPTGWSGGGSKLYEGGLSRERGEARPVEGRYPANLIHDGSGEVLANFPDSNGVGGSAARFFYCAKANRRDRNEGCEARPQRVGGMVSNTSGQHITRRDEGYEPKPQGNHHPTVKPTDLMAYLCRLVTPPGGVVLDPFMGSGSTGKAAMREGFRFIGIEREAEYLEIARARISAVAPEVRSVDDLI